MKMGIVPKAPGTSNVMKVGCGLAASTCANAKSMPTLTKVFRRIFVFIRCVSFVCPFTEVLQEIRRDITRKRRTFFNHECTRMSTNNRLAADREDRGSAYAKATARQVTRIKRIEECR